MNFETQEIEKNYFRNNWNVLLHYNSAMFLNTLFYLGDESSYNCILKSQNMKKIRYHLETGRIVSYRSVWHHLKWFVFTDANKGLETILKILVREFC